MIIKKTWSMRAVVILSAVLICVGIIFLVNWLNNVASFNGAEGAFKADVASWYEPEKLKVPAVVFRTDKLAIAIKVSRWNLQIRLGGKEVLRDISGVRLPDEALIWDGLVVAGQPLPPESECQAMLTIQDTGQGYQLFSCDFRTGVAFVPVEQGYEAVLGNPTYRFPDKSGEPALGLGDDDINRIQSLAAVLATLSNPALTIFASGLPERASKTPDTTLAMKRGSFIRRVLRDAMVATDRVQLSMLPDGGIPDADVRIVIDAESMQALMAAKSKH